MSGSSAIVLSNRSYPTPEVASVFAKDLYDWQTLSTLSAMPTGGSISRSGNAMLYDSTGKLTYAPNNLLLNTATLSTQSVTTAAINYILSFKGTGSVALSGAYSGSLAGTGASNRVSLAFTSTSASLTLTVTGTVTEAQLEAVTYQTTPSTYVATTSAAYYGPRFDYDPATLAAKGLLLEGSRTNLLTYSQNFSQAIWAVGGTATKTASAATCPDGSINAYTISVGTGSNFFWYNSLTIASGTRFEPSIWIKKSSSTGTLRIQSANGSSNGSWSIDLSLLGSGFERITRSHPAVTVTTEFTGSGNTFNGMTFVAAGGTLTFDVFGAQQEAGTFSTSYIRTVASTVARAAETFSISGYSSNLIEAYYTDEATGLASSLPYNAGVAPSPSYSWLTSLRVYTNAYAGDIASPSWIDNSGTTGNRMCYDSTGTLTWAPANLLLNTATLSTQTVTGGVAAGGDYILSFKGTGSVAISGGHTATLAGTGANNRVFLKFASTTASLTFTVTGSVTEAQLERVTYQTQPRAYIPTTSAAVYQPRYDFDASTVPATPRGMLIEESRANLIKSSANLTTTSEGNPIAGWAIGSSGTGAVATANSGVCPDGSNTATLLDDQSSAAIAGKMQTVTVTSGTTSYSGSVFLKAGTSSVASLRVALSGGTVVAGELVVNLANGSAQWRTGITGISFVIQPVGNGWYRASVAITDNASGNTNLAIEIRPSYAATYTATPDVAAVGDCLAWGAQLEVGAFSTSYVPTTSASVTRVADVVKWTSAAFSSYWNAANGSIVVEGQIPNSGGGLRRLVSVSDGTNNNAISSALNSAGTQGYGEARTANVTEASILAGTVSVGSVFRNSLAYRLNDYAFATNGSTAVTDTSGSVPTVTNLYFGLSANLGNVANGYIRSFGYYNQRLPDAILKSKSIVGAPY